jgi:hypothetical protein
MAKYQIRWALPAWVCVAAIVGGGAVPGAVAQVSESLRPPSAFTDIADRGAIPCPLRRGSESHNKPAVHELPSRRRQSKPRGRRACPPAGDVSRGSGRRCAWTALRRVSYGQKLRAFSWGGKLSDYSWPPPLGLGADRDGMAGQITESDLSADKGSRAKRRAEPRFTRGAHGKG